MGAASPEFEVLVKVANVIVSQVPEMLSICQWRYGTNLELAGLLIMTTTIAPPTLFQGQYRPHGHSGPWVTFCERASEPATWDELLVMPALVGCELRVIRVSEADHGQFDLNNDDQADCESVRAARGSRASFR
jgi:hypothetical protein